MLNLGKDLQLLPVPQPATDAVAELVDRYDRNRDQYRSAAYNQARLRQGCPSAKHGFASRKIDRQEAHSGPDYTHLHRWLRRSEGCDRVL